MFGNFMKFNMEMSQFMRLVPVIWIYLPIFIKLYCLIIGEKLVYNGLLELIEDYFYVYFVEFIYYMYYKNDKWKNPFLEIKSTDEYPINLIKNIFYMVLRVSIYLEYYFFKYMIIVWILINGYVYFVLRDEFNIYYFLIGILITISLGIWGVKLFQKRYFHKTTMKEVKISETE